jgi:hypothetical protein
VKPGDLLVSDGQSRLKPGSTVQVLTEPPQVVQPEPHHEGPRFVSAWCIDHPVATMLLTFALVLLGAIAFPRLPVAPLPEAEFPTIQVTAQLPGASPETMASSVATPLEVQFSAIPGMTQMTPAVPWAPPT